MSTLPGPAQALLFIVIGALADTIIAAAIIAGQKLATAFLRLSQPHRGAHIPGAAPRPQREEQPFYGSMSLADERRLHLPGVSQRAGETWHDTAERELAPAALAEENEPGGLYIEVVPDDRPGPDGWHGSPPVTTAPCPAEASSVKGDTSGPGHPVADLLAAMSDDEFWYAAKFELRALAWMASEPFKLPAWETKAIAA